jgi:hypothetical protein
MFSIIKAMMKLLDANLEKLFESGQLIPIQE